MEKFNKVNDQKILVEDSKTCEKNETSDKNKIGQNFIEIGRSKEDNPEYKLFKNDYTTRINEKLNKLKSKNEANENLDKSVNSSKSNIQKYDDSGFSILSELDEDEQKELFERLRTKKGFYSQGNEKSLKTKENLETKIIGNGSENSKSYNPIFQTNLEIAKKTLDPQEGNYSLSKSKSKEEIVQESDDEVVEKKIKKLSSLEINFPVVQLIKKGTEKMKIINNRGKRIMNSYDFFYYDKDKWPSKLNEAQKLSVKLKEFEERRFNLLNKQILKGFDGKKYEKEKLARLEEKRKRFDMQTNNLKEESSK